MFSFLFRSAAVLMLLLGPVLAPFGSVEGDRTRVLAVAYLAILVLPHLTRLSARSEIALQLATAAALALLAILQTFPAGWHGAEITVYVLAAAFAALGSLPSQARQTAG